MRCIVLKTPDGRTVNASESTIVLSTKEDLLRMSFGGLDKTDPNRTYQWYTKNLVCGDVFSIGYADVEASDLSEPESIIDYNDCAAMDRMVLENYMRLKAELLSEGEIELRNGE